MSHKRVIVVGTTSDYIDIINRLYPDRCLFITDPDERARFKNLSPSPGSEVLHDLTDFDGATTALQEHLESGDIKPSGIVAYDDESMHLASHMAGIFNLPYPPAEAVTACRNKYLSKKIWRDNNISCPEAAIIRELSEATVFLSRVKRPIILKPLTGSGSELVFQCKDKYDCLSAFMMTRTRLAEHANTRMYKPLMVNGQISDPRQLFEIEEFIQGREYSCDFIIDGEQVDVIRIARKIPAENQPFGTTLAYIIPSELPARLDPDQFTAMLRGAAQTLGIKRAICMLDFIVRNDRAYLLELAPRPGGDCLPPLVRQSSNLDMLGLALDFAEGQTIKLPKVAEWKKMVGLRLFAGHEGVIDKIDVSRLSNNERIHEIYLKRSTGHRVILPPDDYESRILGHIIFSPVSDDYKKECLELSTMVDIHMEGSKWSMTMGF